MSALGFSSSHGSIITRVPSSVSRVKQEWPCQVRVAMDCSPEEGRSEKGTRYGVRGTERGPGRPGGAAPRTSYLVPAVQPISAPHLALSRRLFTSGRGAAL